MMEPKTREPDVTTDSRVMALMALVAAAALALAINANNGMLSLQAFKWFNTAIAFVLLSVILGRVRAVPVLMKLSSGIILVCLAATMANMFTQSPAHYLHPANASELNPFFYGMAIAAIVSGAGALNPSAGRLQGLAMIALFIGLGLWVLNRVPSPHVDTWVWHQSAFEALMRGENPYAITIQNIYGHGDYYGPGAIEAGRVTYGFLYSPLSLILGLPGYLIAGDYRYANLILIAIAAWIVLRTRPGIWTQAAVALFLFQPKAFFVLEQGWTEPSSILTLALVLWAATKCPRLLPYFVGLFLASKQHLVLLAPLTLLLMPGTWSWRVIAGFGVRAAVAWGVIWLPFAIIDMPALWHSAVMFHIQQPFRTDSLSYPAWFDGKNLALPTWLGFTSVLATSALALWRLPRTPAAFALSVALVCVFFFASSKQAFANYYYFVIAALCWAVAVARTNAPSGEGNGTPTA